MTNTIRLPRRSLLTALILGAIDGAIFLGVGGRVAMRIFAILDGRAPGFTVGGTVPVILMGAAWGTLGGALLWLGRRLFPGSPAARGAVFWIPLSVLYLQGLRPFNADSLIAFTPFYLAYGAALYRVWCHRFVARWAPGSPLVT
jgi:hypothetical protein